MKGVATLAAGILGASWVGLACDSFGSNPAQSSQGSASSGMSTGATMSLTGCGVPCSAQNPCTGQGMACLPAAKGGTVCKPSTCDPCPGKFCAYDTNTCEPSGCTSAACGFAYTGACDDCVKASCCAQNLTCAHDPGCAAVVTCAAKCSGSACTATCEQGASPSSVAAFNATVHCNEMSCGPQCYNQSLPTSSSASSSTSASTGSGQPVCNPPCIANETCVAAPPPNMGVYICQGDPCANTTCPTVTCKNNVGSYNETGCKSLVSQGRFAAACNPAINSWDTAIYTCTGSPANSMRCVFAEGQIDCPAIYIVPNPPYTPAYVEGCCSDQIVYDNGIGNPPHASPFCGVPATVGCAPIDPGNPNYTPAP